MQGSATTPSSLSGKKGRRFGLVQGSASVVHQVHALVVHKCLKAVGRVLRVDRDLMNGVRVVVLVDVYLPIAVLSGWQFPKMGSVAALLFRHLRCVNRDCRIRSLVFWLVAPIGLYKLFMLSVHRFLVLFSSANASPRFDCLHNP